MSLRTFFQLVEIQTKIASIFPFLIGSLFVVYYFDSFNFLNTFIFFSSMILFDFTTTAINHYMDYKKAKCPIYKYEKNVIGRNNLSERTVRIIIGTMLTSAIALGLLLVALTDLFVLFLGICCFFVGVFYTYGPIPLSRMPVGEVFAGLTMGFGIVFLIVYVNAFDQRILNFTLQEGSFTFQANIPLLLHIVLISLPCVFTIAALMLANNLCDLEEDIRNKRFTLPYFLGKNRSITLFNWLYIGTFLSIFLAVYLRLMPIFALLSLIVIFPVYENARIFNRKQVKTETFPLAVKNLVLINGAIVTVFSLSLIL